MVGIPSAGGALIVLALIYTLEKNAKYVRASPRMAKSSTTQSEYFRQSYRPMFIPLVQKIISELSSQASKFQITVDNVADRFLIELHEVADALSKSLPKNQIRHSRRFAGLSILTCANKLLRGFCNKPHIDKYDETKGSIYKAAHSKIVSHVETYIAQHREMRDVNSLIKSLDHVKRLSKDGKFRVYTTCGYLLFLKNPRTKRSIVYFIYNGIKKAVRIPENNGYYHSFAAMFGEHQTAVPITVSDGFVNFNDPDMFVFAWGNGRKKN